MRLLTLPLTLPFKILRGALSLLQGSDEPARTPTRVPPQPKYFRPRTPAPGNGGAPPASAEPVHVSEEPELVAEVAEEGAEEGAGAELHVDPPWPGYDSLKAADIRDRLRVEGPEAAAAVQLYEAANKGRSSVLEAAVRTLSARPCG
jgi:hypothetical protein